MVELLECGGTVGRMLRVYRKHTKKFTTQNTHKINDLPQSQRKRHSHSTDQLRGPLGAGVGVEVRHEPAVDCHRAPASQTREIPDMSDTDMTSGQHNRAPPHKQHHAIIDWSIYEN